MRYWPKKELVYCHYTAGVIRCIRSTFLKYAQFLSTCSEVGVILPLVLDHQNCMSVGKRSVTVKMTVVEALLAVINISYVQTENKN